MLEALRLQAKRLPPRLPAKITRQLSLSSPQRPPAEVLQWVSRQFVEQTRRVLLALVEEEGALYLAVEPERERLCPVFQRPHFRYADVRTFFLVCMDSTVVTISEIINASSNFLQYFVLQSFDHLPLVVPPC